MITVTFFKSADYFKGFKISGHADFNTSGPDIVCAGVSSAAIMTANTITEVLHTDAEVTDSDGFINLNLSSNEATEASHLIEGLWLHLSALQKQYKKFIKVIIAEVLGEGEYRINEVCFIVGFNNPSYFARCFQKQFGILPKDYVKKGNIIREVHMLKHSHCDEKKYSL